MSIVMPQLPETPQHHFPHWFMWFSRFLSLIPPTFFYNKVGTSMSSDLYLSFLGVFLLCSVYLYPWVFLYVLSNPSKTGFEGSFYILSTAWCTLADSVTMTLRFCSFFFPFSHPYPMYMGIGQNLILGNIALLQPGMGEKDLLHFGTGELDCPLGGGDIHISFWTSRG